MYSRRVAKFLISKMPFPVLYETFYQSARALGIRSYEITGSTGAFFGPTYDQSVTKSYLRTGSWSTNLVGLFQRFFEQAGGGTFYDIGGNIGLVTVPVSRDPKVRCVVFEPDPHNCMLLRANVVINSGGSNVEIVNAAVAAEKGELGLVRSDYNSGDHYLSDRGGIRVPVVRLDDYPAAPGPFAVKIDTQGAEPAIFRGGGATLATADLIVCEFWPWGMRRMGLDPEPVIDFAARNFSQGGISRHDGPIDAGQDMAQVVTDLRTLVAAGGKYDAADLILTHRVTRA